MSTANTENFHAWWLSLPMHERNRYAARAGTSPAYIGVHLAHKRKRPKVGTMRRLAAASNGRWSYADILAFFYAD
jgi:hypothetical protein